jgi:hypothetical protein
MNLRRLMQAAGLLAIAIVIVLRAECLAAGEDAKIAVDVDCHCPDPVGQDFCSALKQKVGDSPGYRLANGTGGFGMGVHFSCVDLWQGINGELTGHMSAVSVAFTIFSDKLPGEVFEDSSVFRVGKEAIPEMTDKILTALGRLVSVNSALFERMRATAQKPAPSPTP